MMLKHYSKAVVFARKVVKVVLQNQQNSKWLEPSLQDVLFPSELLHGDDFEYFEDVEDANGGEGHAEEEEEHQDDQIGCQKDLFQPQVENFFENLQYQSHQCTLQWFSISRQSCEK